MQITKSGALIRLCPLEQEDLIALSAWEPYENPILERCRLPYRSPGEWQKWFQQAQAANSDVLGIRDILDNRIAGLLTSKPSRSERGISLSVHFEIESAQCRKGYAYDAVAAYLENVFDSQEPSDAVRISIPAYNDAAIHLMQKFSFIIEESFWERERLGKEVLAIPEFRVYNRFFRGTGDVIETMVHQLRLDRLNWKSRKASILEERKKYLLRGAD